jgi:hypothetical protein
MDFDGLTMRVADDHLVKAMHTPGPPAMQR